MSSLKYEQKGSLETSTSGRQGALLRFGKKNNDWELDNEKTYFSRISRRIGRHGNPSDGTFFKELFLEGIYEVEVRS